jgi:hypothetical protein
MATNSGAVASAPSLAPAVDVGKRASPPHCITDWLSCAATSKPITC